MYAVVASVHSPSRFVLRAQCHLLSGDVAVEVLSGERLGQGSAGSNKENGAAKKKEKKEKKAKEPKEKEEKPKAKSKSEGKERRRSSKDDAGKVGPTAFDVTEFTSRLG